MTREVVVVGGGPAGAAAAIALARGGAQVTLLEREAAPAHTVCGEFLSAEALDSLAALGVDLDGLGAPALHSVRLAGAGKTACVALPFPARSLTRKRMDAAMLERAEGVGVEVQRGVTVRALQPGPRWRVQLSTGGEVAAPDVVLATGKHDLRGRLRPAGAHPALTGMKMYFALAPGQAAALDGHVELILFRGGYAGLQAVEEGAANLCCLFDRALLRQCRGDWARLLEHMQGASRHLRERLTGARAVLAQPLAISSLPYGFTRRETEPGLWQVGDQAAVIPSFTGDGMSMALASGELAGRMLLEGASAGEFQARMQRSVARQVGLATVVSRGVLSPLARPLLAQAAMRWPGVLRHVATATRFREKA